ncbi:hypothetical protein BDY21DRAFT_70459 [Lineolata rhizophorae]|uniref:Uncharacterized protein n=1 Tax=Lineolata rhizophorae TaxID=578093 RepID=A0A6A6NVE8_9PEZI|nr:hypothetical protein BDY21DRAFT_70459 [Lineolata rhizophorae]
MDDLVDDLVDSKIVGFMLGKLVVASLPHAKVGLIKVQNLLQAGSSRGPKGTSDVFANQCNRKWRPDQKPGLELVSQCLLGVGCTDDPTRRVDKACITDSVLCLSPVRGRQKATRRSTDPDSACTYARLLWGCAVAATPCRTRSLAPWSADFERSGRRSTIEYLTRALLPECSPPKCLRNQTSSVPEVAYLIDSSRQAGCAA